MKSLALNVVLTYWSMVFFKSTLLMSGHSVPFFTTAWQIHNQRLLKDFLLDLGGLADVAFKGFCLNLLHSLHVDLVVGGVLFRSHWNSIVVVESYLASL